jgi:hypothetical protein
MDTMNEILQRHRLGKASVADYNLYLELKRTLFADN